ncbi:MAG: polynucleotide kinase-phosphatase [Thermomicrobiales bacterium]
MNLTIPDLSLVVLVGVSGSGKSTFARTHFGPAEVISSDFCRGLVSNDENSLEATADAFEVLQLIVAKRLRRGLLTVVDATNVQPEARKPLVVLAREHDVLPVAIVLDLPERIARERNRARPDRDFGAHVIRRQSQALRRSLRALQRAGFRYVWVLSTPEEVEAAVVERQPLWVDKRGEHGPFDVIGDVHGCFDELCALLAKLGYEVRETLADDGGVEYAVQPPAGRTAVFLGDLVDRGPKVPETLRLVMSMVAAGTALCIPGNHDAKLLRKLKGREVQIAHGLAESLAQLEAEPPTFRDRVKGFLDGLVSHYVFDDGKLVVAHAGMKEELQGRASARVRDFSLYGETTGESDELGLPVRVNWAADYRGRARVVYGHTPVREPEWLNGTINIDTGCVFGGKLTALRYPELELVSVPAARIYVEPVRALPIDGQMPDLTAQQRHDDLLDLADVLGRRTITTRLMRAVTIGEANAAAALEVMSRFALDPKWLIYLPPTMSPTETSALPDLLEHPAEAFAVFRKQGVPRVVCEEKHMGSRAVVVLCRDEDAARRRFGVVDGTAGVCYTRTGRRFFDDIEMESGFLDRIRTAMTAAGLWKELATDWVCLDAELMPWSVKAQELLRRQYAAVGAAARAAIPEAVDALQAASEAGVDVDGHLARQQERLAMVERYVEAYQRYVWPIAQLIDLKLAPFHLLASEGAVHVDKDHGWHLAMLARLCAADPVLLLATDHRIVDITDPASVAAAIEWWETLTARGGEGIVVKPLPFICRGPRGLVQPAIKCRGREYLRIIYGPEYTAPEHLERLRPRGLAAKRSLAPREFSLGVEALERFVAREPLRRVHECVFGVLAIESEPVDPRL